MHFAKTTRLSQKSKVLERMDRVRAEEGHRAGRGGVEIWLYLLNTLSSKS
jgi:hypothetical protein